MWIYSSWYASHTFCFTCYHAINGMNCPDGRYLSTCCSWIHVHLGEIQQTTILRIVFGLKSENSWKIGCSMAFYAFFSFFRPCHSVYGAAISSEKIVMAQAAHDQMLIVLIFSSFGFGPGQRPSSSPRKHTKYLAIPKRRWSMNFGQSSAFNI